MLHSLWKARVITYPHLLITRFLNPCTWLPILFNFLWIVNSAKIENISPGWVYLFLWNAWNNYKLKYPNARYIISESFAFSVQCHVPWPQWKVNWKCQIFGLSQLTPKPFRAWPETKGIVIPDSTSHKGVRNRTGKKKYGIFKTKLRYLLISWKSQIMLAVLNIHKS